MKRNVQIYIEGELLDLFNDEQISVNSSVQNISDISKVFTDFSQSFTVPATTRNNAIFQHFYQSDVNSTIDFNLRRDAVIEIDLTTFRRGKIQLEKSNIKNNVVDSYTIGFYGDVVTLKDRFGEDKLFNLDFSALAFEYNPTNVYDRITDLATDYDVRFPLITSKRFWTYHYGTEDITSTAKEIRSEELFPALKINRIFQAIAQKYGVTFNGAWLGTKQFTECFLWLKNTNEFSFITETQPIDLSAITTNFIGGLNPYDASSFVDLTNNSINFQYLNDVISHTIVLTVLSKSAIGILYIEVYQDGNLWQVLEVINAGVSLNIGLSNTSGLNTVITFKAKANAQMTVDFSLRYNIEGLFDDGINPPSYDTNYCVISTASNVLTGNINLNNLMPDMKVQDFFSGILKQFNMTCVGVEPNVFEVLPLDDWYSQGAVVDVTKYVTTDSIDIERLKLYKKISFKYQDSESFVNQNYFAQTNQKYGNLEYQFNYDGSEYTIESAFENLLFTRATDNAGSEAILGYCLTTSFNSYVPKPCLFYLYGESDVLDHDIKFADTSGHLNISTYALFGQDLTYNNTKYSLNFGVENSIIHLEPIQYGLYATYYFPYLVNLYNLHNRLVSVKAILPISLLTSIRLNDRLIIRDKRYIINEMKTNLVNGEVDLSLYLDFRPVINDVTDEKTNEAQCIEYKINLPNGAVLAELITSFIGVTISPDTFEQSGISSICIPANTSGLERTITILVTYTFSDGLQASNTITIIQGA